MDLRAQVQKYRQRAGQVLSVGDKVLFRGELYNKGLITEIRGSTVKIKVPNTRQYVDQSTGEVQGRAVSRHVGEIVKADFPPEMRANGVKLLFTNKFQSEDVGDVEIRWREALKDDIFTFLEGARVVHLARPNGDNCWKYVEYEKDGKKYLIPATAAAAIPVQALNECDIGLNRDFEVTTVKEQIIYPLGIQSGIRDDDVKRAFNLTIESRKRNAMNELSQVRSQLITTGEKLAGLKRQNDALADTINLLEDKQVSDERVARAKRVIGDQWEEFKVEGLDHGTRISVGAYIYHTMPSTGKKYDIGYCTVQITYPDNLSHNPTVVISNTNNPRQGHPHPYVATNGQPCYGAGTEEANKALGSGDFERFLGYLYEYLTNSEGRPYLSPTKWALVKED